METKNKSTSLVQGFHHHLRFLNGFKVYGWTQNKISRNEAIKELIKIANSGQPIYCTSDIENYWTTKK